ncbi:MAG: hypothetical protein L0312_26510, partial [Acidobacteria bacterium]|nr:hypothetical protein [Acidobacteriota bacterium]
RCSQGRTAALPSVLKPASTSKLDQHHGCASASIVQWSWRMALRVALIASTTNTNNVLIALTHPE